MRPGFPDVVVLESSKEVGTAISAFAPYPELHSLTRRIYLTVWASKFSLAIIEREEAEASLRALFSLAALNSINAEPTETERAYHNREIRPLLRRERLQQSDKALAMICGYMNDPQVTFWPHAGFENLNALLPRKPIGRFLGLRR